MSDELTYKEEDLIIESGMEKEREKFEQLCPRCDCRMDKDEDRMWTCSGCGARWRVTDDEKSIVEEGEDARD